MSVYGPNWMVRAAFGEAAFHLAFGGICVAVIYQGSYEKVIDVAPSLYTVANLTIYYCLFAAIRAILTLLIVTILQRMNPKEP